VYSRNIALGRDPDARRFPLWYPTHRHSGALTVTCLGSICPKSLFQVRLGGVECLIQTFKFPNDTNRSFARNREFSEADIRKY